MLANQQQTTTTAKHITAFTDATFEEQVLKSPKPVLVDFWAEWCAPCRMIGPTVEKVAEEYEGRAIVGKMNVDENPSVIGRYHITGIPSLLLFKDGKVQEQIVGATSRDNIVRMIDKYL